MSPVQREDYYECHVHNVTYRPKCDIHKIVNEQSLVRAMVYTDAFI